MGSTENTQLPELGEEPNTPPEETEPQETNGENLSGGTSLLEQTPYRETPSLDSFNLADFELSQDDNGILNVEGTGSSEGIKFTFIPDADNVIQVDDEKVPVGLSVSEGGFYRITTPQRQQFKVIPAPQDPVKLSELTGQCEIIINRFGDVLLEMLEQTRRGGAREVAIFDPYIEPAPADLCVEITPNEFVCDFEHIPAHLLPEHLQPGIYLPRNRAKLKLPKGQVVYQDGSSQLFTATVFSPEVFMEEGLKLEGVERVVYNANGTFYAEYQDNPYIVFPNFGLRSKPVSETAVPSLVPNYQGGVTYSIPINFAECVNTRRQKGGRGARQMLIFDPFIEPAPANLCVEINFGEFACDFDHIPEEHAQWVNELPFENF